MNLNININISCINKSAFSGHQELWSLLRHTDTMKCTLFIAMCLPLDGSLCSIMPKWQICTYVSRNLSNCCHFIQIFIPQGQQIAEQQAHMFKQTLPFLSQPAGMVISALLLAAEALSIAGGLQTTRLDDLQQQAGRGTRHKTLMSHSALVQRLPSPRARIW